MTMQQKAIKIQRNIIAVCMTHKKEFFLVRKLYDNKQSASY